jgi:hypothetical protein
MKPMGFNRHKYSGDLYKFVRRTIGTESQLEYYFSKSINLTAGLDKSNRMTIRCNEPVDIGCLISDIKDANGDPILSEITWQITAIQPVLNAFNTIDSYTMLAVKFQGTING